MLVYAHSRHETDLRVVMMLRMEIRIAMLHSFLAELIWTTFLPPDARAKAGFVRPLLPGVGSTRSYALEGFRSLGDV